MDEYKEGRGALSAYCTSLPDPHCGTAAILHDVLFCLALNQRET